MQFYLNINISQITVTINMAERGGFEPPVELPPQQFSRLPPSASSATSPVNHCFGLLPVIRETTDSRDTLSEFFKKP
jgi:hypothetical protein